jgi:broad specificity phosphatase PhoE
LVFAVSALAATSITVTFVRHAESQANADGVIDTKVPGPHLSDPVGLAQAQAIRDALAGNGYDGIYASDMIRTQETAQPLANLLGKSITVLPGLHEIDAGVYEGSSQNEGWDRLGYALTPLLWTPRTPVRHHAGLDGLRRKRLPAPRRRRRQDIYDSGNQNPVVFSHGATIMFWTLMNVDNPDLFLLFTHPLNNTSVVVINGNPEDGWKLVNWDGVSVDAEPSLLMKMFVDLRDLIVAPQEAAYAVSHAFDSGNLFEAADALIKAAIKLGLSPIDFVISVAKNLIDEIFKPATPSGASTAAVEAAPEPAARLAVASEPVTAEAAPPTATSTPEVTRPPARNSPQCPRPPRPSPNRRRKWRPRRQRNRANRPFRPPRRSPRTRPRIKPRTRPRTRRRRVLRKRTGPTPTSRPRTSISPSRTSRRMTTLRRRTTRRRRMPRRLRIRRSQPTTPRTRPPERTQAP